MPGMAALLARAGWPAVLPASEHVLAAAALGGVPDRPRGAQADRSAGRRPSDVGLRLPAPRQHVAGVASGPRGELYWDGVRDAPKDPLRHRAAALRALTASPARHGPRRRYRHPFRRLGG